MLRNTFIGLFVGTSLSLGGLFIDSASAQTSNPPNLSDNTGPITIPPDTTPPTSEDITGTGISTFAVSNGFSFQVNPGIITQAEQLASDLMAAFNASGTPSDIDIRPLDLNRSNVANSRCERTRRFSLDKPQTTNSNCDRADNTDNSEFEELNALLEKADEFLEDIDRQVETTNRAIANRLW